MYESDISEEAELDSYTDPVDEKGSGGVGGCAMCSGKSPLSPRLWEGEVGSVALSLKPHGSDSQGSVTLTWKERDTVSSKPGWSPPLCDSPEG